MYANTSAHHDESSETLPLDVLEDAAEMLAEGRSWESVAAAVEWGARDLRRACRADPRFPEQLELARRELLDRAEAEALHTLRELLRAAGPKERAKAAEQLAKYLTARRACEARVRVEEVKARAKAASARARGRRAGAEEQEEAEEPLTPEQERHERELRERAAERAVDARARDTAAVFLWGGCHKLDGAAPDATDTPLEVFEDHTIPSQGGKRVFWAVALPCRVDPYNGPFLDPPAAACAPPDAGSVSAAGVPVA
jgi:hypothetical protein